MTQGIITEIVGRDGVAYVPSRHSGRSPTGPKAIAGWNGNPKNSTNDLRWEQPNPNN